MTLQRVIGLVLLLAGAAAGAADESLPPQEEVLDYESRRQINVIPDADIPTEILESEEVFPPPPWQAEEDALWTLIRERQMEALDDEIARMDAAWPDWDPPARLLALAAETRLRIAVEAARSSGDDAALIGLAAVHPGFFSCSELGNAWALAEARGRRDGPAAEAATYAVLLEACVDPAADLANLMKLRPLIPPGELLSYLGTAALENPVLAANPEFRRLDLEIRREVAATFAGEGRFAEVILTLEPAAEPIIDDRDLDAAALLAWSYAEEGRPPEALDWEERLAAWGRPRYTNLALARAAAGDTVGALEVAESVAADDPAAAELAFGLRMARAAEAEDCEVALDELAAARRWGTLSPDERRLEAWALVDCDRSDEAAAAFAMLYRETGSDEDARGLVAADWKRKEIEHATALAEELGGPLADRVPEPPLPLLRGKPDYEELVYSDEGRVAVIKRHGWSVWSGVGLLARRGDGPGHLDAWRTPLARASLTRQMNRWQLDLDRLDLGANATAPGDWPLDLAVPYSPAADEDAQGFEGRLAWRQDRAFSNEQFDVEVAVGFTPTGQAISPTLTGRLAVGQGRGPPGWTLAIERDSIRESLTSWTGTGGSLEIDGTTVVLPFHWGRVTRNAVSFSGYDEVSADWAVGGSARLGVYTGENVPDNTGGEVYAEVQRVLTVTGPWRLSAGPWLYVSAFDKNLGRFSPGHGGYFSPEWLGQGGLSVRASGFAPATPWYLDARLDLGWQRHREAAADLIPYEDLERLFLEATGLDPGALGRFEPRTTSGFAGGLDIEGMRRVARTAWHVGALLSVRFAPEYDETALMAVFRYGSEPSATKQDREFRSLFRSRR